MIADQIKLLRGTIALFVMVGVPFALGFALAVGLSPAGCWP